MVNRNVIAIIQARMASSRLPGKVLRDLAGEPMLVRVVERVRRAKTVQQVIVATTVDKSDDVVAALCDVRSYQSYRGSQQDVLDRYYRAASTVQADIIVRVTADCPVIDPALIDETVEVFLGLEAAEGPFDFAASRLPPPYTRTYPIGQDIEVCTMTGLERAWREATQTFQREHVMPYFYEGIQLVERVTKRDRPGYLDVFQTPRGFHIVQVNHAPDYGRLRWTVDTSSDLALLEQIYVSFTPRVDFTWLEILELVQKDPLLSKLNAGVYHKDFRESEQKA
jgi:spore coat polysaccharide biosynthesis protein SpsF